MKKNCFAFIKEGECFALSKQKCENCEFYKSRRLAKEQYIKRRVADYEIDKYFMNL